MWAVSIRPPLGGVPILRWAIAFFAALVAAFLCLLVLSPSAHAADATWENNGIRYDNQTYQGPRSAPANSPLAIEEGAQYYESRDGNTVRIIYFPENADINEATGAQFAQYQFSSPDTYARDGQVRSISIDKKSEVAGEDGERREEGTTSCAVNGIGYILCPIMGFIADAMDSIFDYLRALLEVRPLSNDRNSGLYRAWEVMLSFANVAFIVALLVVVYSYISGFGLKQHDIRFMLPRLIIAAVLVNVSYFICAALVDISNIIGGNLQDLLMGIRQDVASGDTANELEGLRWGEITAFILSGGTIAAAGAMQLSAAGASVIYMLVPVLVIAATAIFVTVAVLAARQALITILIMIAPLAFVAFVLPGTQKYFDRWRGIFQTMLLMYPIFSILFGGSQLAGYLIAQNAARPEVVLLAMFVQAAPLIITPFLIKFSGGLLGKFAGIVNNPAKGLGDRAKNWATERRDVAKARRLANNSFGSGLARWSDDRRRKQESDKEYYETKRKGNYAKSSLGRRMALRQMNEAGNLETAENMQKKLFEDQKLKDDEFRMDAAKLKLSELELDASKVKMDTRLNEMMSEEGRALHPRDVAARALGQHMQAAKLDSQVWAKRNSFAENEQTQYYNDQITRDIGLQQTVGGVRGSAGEMLAAAQATQELRADFGKDVAAQKELFKHIRLGGGDIHQLAKKGGPVTVTDDSGRTFNFDASNDYTHEAAVELLMNEKGNFEQKMEIVKLSGQADFAGVRGTITDGVKATMMSAAPYLGGRTLDILETTGIDQANPEEHIARTVRDFVKKGKMNQTALVNADAVALETIHNALAADPATGRYSYDGIDRADRLTYDSFRQDVKNAAKEALKNDQLKEAIKDNARPILRDIENL